ncbi:phage/plasmid primase, P4 family [Methanosarcina hadiensis]|uniref:phage/plasmid primase, P4 family n=1 Tax=Methanosarcina hadiensis TaxID=3078083 RepID=UPI00397766F7
MTEINDYTNIDRIAVEPTTIDSEAYPSELKDYDQWLLWKLEPQAKGKPKKVPYCTSGYKASSTNPKTWSSFDEAFDTYQNSAGAYSGIGFVFTKEDPFLCADYDGVIDSMGIIDPEISEEIKIYNSYSEISQSGTGIHVIVTGTVPGSRKRGNGREIYGEGQFIAITGNHLKSTPFTVNEVSEEVITDIYDKMIKPVENSSKSKISAGEHLKESEMAVKSGTSDFSIFEKCKSAKSADRFNLLYGGNWDVSGCYPSQNEADLALCSMFAAYTQDRSQIDRLFTGSGLYREKWTRVDYKESTISKALDRINEDPHRKYFSEGKFIAKLLADEIISEYHFLTFDDNKEVYYYEKGVYIPGGENLITQVAQKKLEQHSTRSRRDETLSYIKVETLTDRNSVNNDKQIINLKNGLYDLKEDKFKPHTPKLLSTTQIPVNYNPDAECPMIDKFLSEVVSEEYIPALLEWIGYSMIPDNRMQKAVMLLGSGSNGKSVFLNLLTEFIGIKNTSGESLQKLEKDKFSAANLHGKLLNVCPDIAGSEVYDSSQLKILTGNEKQIRGEKKGQQAFYFDNTARLIFSANDLPPVRNAGYSYYRRWMLFEFPNRFEGKNADKDLVNKLTTEKELSGLLNKAIIALKKLLENGEFSYHKTIEEVEKMYRLKSDSVAAFADGCIMMSMDDTLKALVYNAYVNWCIKNGEKPKSNVEFGKKFNQLGYQTIRESTGDRKYYWEGVSVKSV